MKRRLSTILGLCLSGVALIVITQTVDLRDATSAVLAANPVWLIIAACAYLSLFLLRGLRWSVLLRPVQPVSVAVASEAFVVGSMANNVLPARLGDVARAIMLGRRTGMSRSTAFSSVMLERVFDGVTIVAILGLVLWFAPPPAAWVRAVGGGMAALFVGALLAALITAHSEARMVRISSRVLGWLPFGLGKRSASLLHKLARGVGVLRNPRASLMTFGLSIAIWVGEIGVYAIAQRAFGLELPWPALAVVMCVLSLGLSAPSSPGFVGVYEGLVIAALAVYGVDPGKAPAFAVTMHLVHALPVTLLGGIFLSRQGLRLAELKNLAHSADGSTADLSTSDLSTSRRSTADLSRSGGSRSDACVEPVEAASCEANGSGFASDPAPRPAGPSTLAS